MHPRPRLVGQRLWHKTGQRTVLQRDLTDHGAKSHDVVRHGQRIRIPQVDLVLARTALVVAELHRDPHLLQHGDGRAAEIVAITPGDVVEVAGVVDRDRDGSRLVGLLEQIELDLGVGVEGEPLVGRLVQRALQDVARIRHGRAAVRHPNVGEHPRRSGVVPPPRQHLERAGVRLNDHVRLVDPRKTLDRAAVEADAPAEGLLQLRRCDGDRLQRPQDVGEPEPHEADIPFLDGAEHVLLLTIHALILPYHVRGA